MKHKILYMSDSSLDKQGGAQQSMKVLMNTINQSKNYEIFILSPNSKKISENHVVLKSFNSFVLKKNNIFNNIKLIFELHRAIKKISPTIIHLQMTSTTVLVNVLKRLGLVSKDIKIIYTDRGVYDKYGLITRKSIDSLIKYSDRIVTTTYNNLKNYEVGYNEFKLHSHKFSVIYNTAGEIYDVYDEEKKKLLKDKMSIDSQDFVIGFCGRYSEQKNWPLAKDIIKNSKNLKNLKVILVLGSDRTENHIKEINCFAKEIEGIIGKDKLISFIDIDNELVSDIYYVIDLFILSSKWESFGRTAVEAMSRKSIVIGTNVDGLAEVIGNSKYLFSSATEASSLITQYKNNKENTLDVQKEFYERYHNYFSTRNNIDSYVNLYRDTII